MGGEILLKLKIFNKNNEYIESEIRIKTKLEDHTIKSFVDKRPHWGMRFTLNLPKHYMDVLGGVRFNEKNVNLHFRENEPKKIESTSLQDLCEKLHNINFAYKTMLDRLGNSKSAILMVGFGKRKRNVVDVNQNIKKYETSTWELSLGKFLVDGDGLIYDTENKLLNKVGVNMDLYQDGGFLQKIKFTEKRFNKLIEMKKLFEEGEIFPLRLMKINENNADEILEIDEE